MAAAPCRGLVIPGRRSVACGTLLSSLLLPVLCYGNTAILFDLISHRNFVLNIITESLITTFTGNFGLICSLENWYYRILILMTGYLKNATVAVDALSIWYEVFLLI